MECAVRHHSAEHLADRLNRSRACCFGGLEDDGRRAHPDHHSVAAPVERRGDLFHDVASGGRTSSQESGSKPFHQRVGAHVICRDHDDAAAATGVEPVFGDRERLRGARARRVDVRIRATRADELSELRVPHGQDPEQEAAVELEGIVFDLLAQAGDASIELGLERRVAGSHSELFELGQALPAGLAFVVLLEIPGEGFARREGGREDDTGVVSHRFREGPACRQERASARLAIPHHQRNARVAQRFEAHGDRQLGEVIQRGDPLRRDPELRPQIKGAGTPGELHHAVRVVDGREFGFAALILDQPMDPLSGHLFA